LASEQNPTLSSFNEPQYPKEQQSPPKSIDDEKGKGVEHKVEYYIRKAHTMPANKLKLKEKIIQNPILKDMVIDAYEEMPIAPRSTWVSEAKSKNKTAKKQRHENTQR
jgi:hypothetical protein